MSSNAIDDQLSSLYIHADNSFRELVAFYEVITETSNRSKMASIREWFDSHEKILDRDNNPIFYENLSAFSEMLRRAYMKADPDDKDGSYKMAMSDKGLDIAFESFMTNIRYRFVDRVEVIGRAVLIAAESSFEVLFGQLVHVIYAKYPSALSSSDYSFTLEELTKYASIEDARGSLIRRRIDNLLRESLNDWDKWLKRTINVSLEHALPDWPVTREIFIRRNMLVHTDGSITERYLNEVRQSGGSIEGLDIGQSLIPSADYMRASLQRLIALEVMLLFQTLSHIEKSRLDQAAASVADKLEFCVARQMWEAACLISDSFDDALCKRDIQLEIKINGWLAHKSRDGLDNIRSQVSSWDVSGLHEKYAIAKSLLLDELTPEELAGAVERGIYNKFEVATHPLFKKFDQSNSERYSFEASEESQTDDDEQS
jgi:hypothetical protein